MSASGRRYRSFAAGPDVKSALVRKPIFIPMRNPVAQLLDPLTEPRSMAMQDQVNATPAPKRAPWSGAAHATAAG